ncbi:hypothetical protein V2J09_017195 [Rumex salicifolius]
MIVADGQKSGTPQQNGIARSIRLQSGLPKQFWAEAINTAACLINRGPSVPLEHQIPEEVWSRKEITLSHLRVFGCTTYVNKLDPKSKKCTFIGYGCDELGYCLWDGEKKKMIHSRDVIFSERIVYKDRHKIEDDDAEKSVLPSGTPQVLAPALRISSRLHVHNRKYMNYLLLTDGGEPECYDEARQTTDASKWELVMKDEMKSLISNKTWELAELYMGKKALHNKWIYRVKDEHDGSKRYKAPLVVK